MNTVNTVHPKATRTLMVISHGPNPEACLQTMSNREMSEEYGQDAVTYINSGQRAIVTVRRQGRPYQMTVYDVVLAAVAHNADLHACCTGPVQR